MLRVAIVEDEKEYIDQIKNYIERYQEEYDQEIKISIFKDGSEILENYQPDYEIILFDIEMPNINGMQAAKKIREQDKDVVLVFITNMAQYAINGYEVGALDFILKPINYSTFRVRFTRAIGRVIKRESGEILLNLTDGMKKLDTKQIYYVDVQNRMLHYHTEIGEFVVRGTLQNAENELKSYHFVKCNHWYLVNLKHVSEIKKNIAIVAGNELEISRRNKSIFLEALADYIGGNV